MSKTPNPYNDPYDVLDEIEYVEGLSLEPRLLCHPDGEIFANWHPTAHAFAVYVSEGAHVNPADLRIAVAGVSMVDQSMLVWRSLSDTAWA